MSRIWKRIVHSEIASNLYLLSLEQLEQDSMMKQRITSQNSYLIVGKERALLFDLTLDTEGLYEYAKKLSQKEVMTVLSHGHFDHIFGLCFLKEVWMHKNDEFLIRKGMPIFGGLPVSPCPILHFLDDRDVIELGERYIEVIHVPGHSPGSIVLLDKNTQILLSGDTVARRVLLGATGRFDKKELCNSLEKLQQEKFDVIYSAHDAISMSKKQLDVMLGVLKKQLPVLCEKFFLAGIGIVPSYRYKDEFECIIFNKGDCIMNTHNLTFGSIPTTCFRTERPAFFHKGSRPVDTDVPIEKLIRQMSQTVRKDVFTIVIDGCPIKVHPKWVRDHVHEMKAYKHWESDLKDYLDFIIKHQHEKGFFYEMVQVEGEEHTKVVNDECLYFDKENGIVLIRLELEADIEYLMVEGVYTVYQATGDLEWMKCVLPALEKGINYCTSDPKRWDSEHGLIKRVFTVDTWDFANREDAQFNRNIKEDDVIGIMHGDNSGVYAAMQTLALMNEEIGEKEKANEWRTRALKIKENLDRYCWNGRFYQHQLLLNSVSEDPLEKERLSLSSTYDMNRGIVSFEQAKSILNEYKSRKATTDAFCEWFTVDPPYEQFFEYSAGEYINGAIASLTAGELAKAAFSYGEEEYGWDILCRLMDILDRDGELFFMYNPATGENAGGGPSGWGAAAILSAIEEGLAGIKDLGVRFNKMLFSPRWCVTDMDEVKYITGYETSHVLVESQYEKSENGMLFRIAAPAKEIQCHILVQNGRNVQKVFVNGKEISFRKVLVGDSRYVDFEISIEMEERTWDRYEPNPVTNIEIFCS